MRRYLLPLVMALLACGLMGWNGSRFVGAQAKIRTKDLSFLPSPTVGKLLALGHHNTVAKLRWIDSFAFFELQLDRKDDTLAGSGQSAFLRLYDLLTSLDGRFRPFYEHAVLNLGGVQGRHAETLSLLQRGLMEQPHDPQLWRLLTVELYMAYQWEQKQPEAFEGVLNAWHDAMEDEQEAQQVWDWKAAFGRRREPGLDQVPYWMAQLPGTQGTQREFILQTLREEIGRYGEKRLSSLVQRFKADRGVLPLAIDDALRAEWLRAEWPHGIPPLAPVTKSTGQWTLRLDPYGWPYRLTDQGTVVSEGTAMFRFRGRVAAASNALATMATKRGSWPATLEEAKTAGLELPTPPSGGTWVLKEHTLEVRWPEAPGKPWTP